MVATSEPVAFAISRSFLPADRISVACFCRRRMARLRQASEQYRRSARFTSGDTRTAINQPGRVCRQGIPLPGCPNADRYHRPA